MLRLGSAHQRQAARLPDRRRRGGGKSAPEEWQARRAHAQHGARARLSIPTPADSSRSGGLGGGAGAHECLAHSMGLVLV